jgi:NosR/NirI family nitrous oxide reductase transcriptional regulator
VVVSKFRIFKIKKPSENCGACKACTVSCSMGIPMYKYDKISSGECIDCFQCLKACPRKNTQASIAGQDVAPLAAGLITTAAIMGVYYIGRLAPSNMTTTALAASISEVAMLDNSESNITISGDYKDGVYTGSAPGYKGTTNVQVTVANGYVSKIKIVSTGDDGEFFNMAKSAVIKGILKAQTSRVDAVTGATSSSEGIMKAVADALSKAGAANTTQSTATLTPLPTAIATTSPDTTTAAAPPTAGPTTGTYADGVYTGTGSGFRGQTVVSVTVSGGQITDIQIVSYRDDEKYFLRACNSVISDIISTQSANVDAVSGATRSSNGVMNAVANALGIAFTNNNSSQSGDEPSHGENEEDDEHEDEQDDD